VSASTDNPAVVSGGAITWRLGPQTTFERIGLGNVFFYLGAFYVRTSATRARQTFTDPGASVAFAAEEVVHEVIWRLSPDVPVASPSITVKP
jgi:hypothetical protein